MITSLLLVLQLLSFGAGHSITLCLPELGYINEVQLSLNGDYAYGNTMCDNSTGLAQDAISMLLVPGSTIPSTCNAELFGEVDCINGKGKDDTGNKKKKKKGKRSKEKSGSNKKGKKSKEKSGSKKKGRKRNDGQVRFDVLVKCNTDPCIEEGLVEEETESKLNQMISDLTNIFKDYRRSHKAVISMSNGGPQFSSKVNSFRKLTSFCSGKPQSEFTPRRNKHKNNSKLRPLDLCGKSESLMYGCSNHCCFYRLSINMYRFWSRHIT